MMRMLARFLALAALAAALVAGSGVGAEATSDAGRQLNPPICC
jgi:hypothetical protein